MIEYRREQQRLFAGTAWHRLVQVDGAIRIAWKRVDLVNCDAPMDGHRRSRFDVPHRHRHPGAAQRASARIRSSASHAARIPGSAPVARSPG